MSTSTLENGYRGSLDASAALDRVAAGSVEFRNRARKLTLASGDTDDDWQLSVDTAFDAFRAGDSPNANINAQNNLRLLVCQKAKELALAANSTQDEKEETHYISRAIALDDLASLAGMNLGEELAALAKINDSKPKTTVISEISADDSTSSRLDGKPKWLERAGNLNINSRAVTVVTVAAIIGGGAMAGASSAKAATMSGMNSSVGYSKLVNTPKNQLNSTNPADADKLAFLLSGGDSTDSGTDQATNVSSEGNSGSTKSNTDPTNLAAILGSSGSMSGNTSPTPAAPLPKAKPSGADQSPSTQQSLDQILQSSGSMSGSYENKPSAPSPSPKKEPTPAPAPTPPPTPVAPDTGPAKNKKATPKPKPAPAEKALTSQQISQKALDEMKKEGPDWHNRAIVMEVLMEHGWKADHAAGAIGNLCVEAAGCNLDPSIDQIGYSGSDEGMGIAQWSKNGRWQTLLEKAREWGTSPTDIETQARFIDWEARHTQSKVLGPISNAVGPNQSAFVFGKYYERPNNLYSSLDKREKYARDTLNEYNQLIKNIEKSQPKPKLKPISVQVSNPTPKYKNIGAFVSTVNIKCAPGSTNAGLETTSLGNTIRLCKVQPHVGKAAIVNSVMSGQTVSLFKDAANAGFPNLGVSSSYRPKEEQIALRKQYCGPTHYDIYEKPANIGTGQVGTCQINVAKPGTSLHEHAEAVDMYYNGKSLNTSMPVYKWLMNYGQQTGKWWSLGSYNDALHWQDRPPAADYSKVPSAYWNSHKNAPTQPVPPKKTVEPVADPEPKKQPPKAPAPTLGSIFGETSTSNGDTSGNDNSNDGGTPPTSPSPTPTPKSSTDPAETLGSLFADSSSTNGDTSSSDSSDQSNQSPETTPTPDSTSQPSNNGNDSSNQKDSIDQAAAQATINAYLMQQH